MATDDDIAQQLAALEPIFHHPELGTSRDDFDRMMAAGFWEVGASGRKYSREFVLDTLEQRHQSPVEEQLTVSDFACMQLSADTWLVTYHLEQPGGRLSRRATLWQRTANGWQALYHQGTLITGA